MELDRTAGCRVCGESLKESDMVEHWVQRHGREWSKIQAQRAAVEAKLASYQQVAEAQERGDWRERREREKD